MYIWEYIGAIERICRKNIEAIDKLKEIKSFVDTELEDYRAGFIDLAREGVDFLVAVATALNPLIFYIERGVVQYWQKMIEKRVLYIIAEYLGYNKYLVIRVTKKGFDVCVKGKWTVYSVQHYYHYTAWKLVKEMGFIY